MPLPDISPIIGGTSILFLGAGFSAEATNIHGQPIKDVQNLTKFLLTEVGETSTEGYDLDTAAEEFQRYHGNLGADKLTDAIHANFRSKMVTDNQRLIVCQPWYRIYTTNYDDVIETICAEEKKPIITRAITDPVSPPVRDHTQLIHIYGNISHASADEFKRHFLLTESQRDNSPFLRSPWMRRFHDDVLAAGCIVFVGFSLNDIDLRRLLGTLPQEVLNKVHFITHPSTGKPVLNRMQKYGRPYPVGLATFATHLDVKRPGPPTRTYTALPMSLIEHEFVQALTTDVSSKDIESLILSGVVDLDKLSDADVSGRPGAYTIPRSQQAYARAIKNSSGEQPILVHADIGNGKTVFAYQLAYQFSQNNYRIFEVQREPENTGDILGYLQALDSPALILFDDIMRFPTLPAAIIRMNRKDIVVLATVRSILIDTSRDSVISRINNATPIEIDLNISSREQARNIVEYLLENGLLGSRSSQSESETLTLIERKCGGQIRDVVLTIYKTGSLHKRVEELVLNLQAMDKSSRDVIGFSALLSYADFDHLCRFSDIADLVNYSGALEELRATLARHELATLVRLDTGDVVIRSPALAQFILQRVFGLEAILEIAKNALFRLDEYYADENDFIKLGKALLKFSAYGPLLNGKRENETIDKFYATCRTLTFAAKDPLFWVQRSICNMHRHQFDISHRYVETAYGLAAKLTRFDTYQIDNHNARLMLTQSLVEGVSSNGKREQNAHSLLMGVISRKSDDLYHPLSVMRLHAYIVDKWRLSLSKEQRDSLKKILDESVATIANFRQPGRFRGLPDLRKRLSEASRLLAKQTS